MASDPITARPVDDIRSALSQMRAHEIGCVAVVDELGYAVGVMTGYDVVTLALRMLDALRAPHPAAVTE